MEVNNYLIFIFMVGFIASIILLFLFSYLNQRNIINLLRNKKKSNVIYTINSLDTKYVGRSPISNFSFYEALYKQKILTAIQESSLSKVNLELKNIFNNQHFIKSAQLISSINVLKDKSIVMTLSKEGQKLLKSKKAELIFDKKTGNLLPLIRDSKNKKFIEQMKGIPKINISKLSHLSNLIVDAAHMISGADLAKKIKLLDKKIDFLIEGRRIDKIGELEANYVLAQQILSKDMISNSEYTALIMIHKDLIKLRSIWRHEIEYKLINIEDPKNRNFFSRKLNIRKYTKSTDKEIYEKISSFEIELLLMDFSIFFDILISDKINYQININDELDFITNIKKLLKTKSKYLTGKYNEYNVNNHIKFLNNLKKRIEHFVPLHMDKSMHKFKSYELIEKN